MLCEHGRNQNALKLVEAYTSIRAQGNAIRNVATVFGEKEREEKMYKIMYRVNETMRRHMSAVVYSEEDGKLVEAHFPTREEAESAAQEWFEGSCDNYYVQKIKPYSHPKHTSAT